MISPCKDCNKRTARCHAECEDYKTYRAKLDEINAEVQKKRETERILHEYEFDIKYSCCKQRGKQK